MHEARSRLPDVCPNKDSARDEEVARLEALGATRIDIGQSGGSWIVMADPIGNEFCVMGTVVPAVARLVAVERPATRELGFLPLDISDDLFAPLSDDELDGWE